MERAGVPRQNGPINVMLSEHETGRNEVRKMSEAVTRYKKGDSDAGREFAWHGRLYVDLLTQHIDKENKILFPMADQRLTQEQQSELLERFDVIEKEKIGEGKHAEFDEWLKNLQSIYLRQGS
jgi:hemerythrin-like domain-containing protein